MGKYTAFAIPSASSDRDRARLLRFAEANGINPKTAATNTLVLVSEDESELVVDEFWTDDEGKREVCINRCGCSAPGKIFQHWSVPSADWDVSDGDGTAGGYRRRAAHYPLRVHPREFQFPEVPLTQRTSWEWTPTSG